MRKNFEFLNSMIFIWKYHLLKKFTLTNPIPSCKQHEIQKCDCIQSQRIEARFAPKRKGITRKVGVNVVAI